ncbi:Argininosuccinate lyase [Actinidia chinensis var. chinensis]|uniref:Argininosuccinate lyase n=1 Tax=Actinidia chinensis var. chinensis TaxID=1590841 RepID=A0A2R6R4V9_ACTCC|nr:Argininosuccinate lyase [Actinidia chinensis var. chinensis]
MSSEQQQASTDADASLKLAIAMALLRSKLVQKVPLNHPPSPSATSESNAKKWKRKAKERKRELLRLKEDLKQAEDNSLCDLFPQSASCKCYFFDNLGKLSPILLGNDSDKRFNDVLRRRFLRQVRLSERRRKRDGSTKTWVFSDCNSEDETEQLRASVDFLVELCDNVSPVNVEETNFLNWSHQAVDFILAVLKDILPTAKNIELLEGIVCSLIVRLVRRMCITSKGDELHQFNTDAQFHVQHLIRKLGSESYVGQRVILSVSQRIAVLAESLLFKDPIDDAFLNMHDCLYMMIQLIEFLVSDYLLTWSRSERFDTRLFEEWATSVLHARKALQVLESRNGLYMLYMDRVIGDLAKQAGQVSSLQKINPDIIANLLR